MTVGQQIVDVDAHVTEMADLWTSRLPRKWHESVPRVDPGPEGMLWWHFGDHLLHPVAMFAHGGWKEYYPSLPATLDEADPATWDPQARLAKMDEYGIAAQVLYPNLLAFEVFTLFEMTDRDLRLAVLQASNDFLADFAAAAPDRLWPVALIPFWDLDATVAEMARCRQRGHRGVNFAMAVDRLWAPARYRPPLGSPVRDPADLELSVNFHIGFSTRSREEWESSRMTDESRRPNNTAKRTALDVPQQCQHHRGSGDGRDLSSVPGCEVCFRRERLRLRPVPALRDGLDVEERP